MSTKNFRVRRGLTIAGETSGSTSLAATTTGSDLSYTLPTAYPASNGYVLASQTDGTMTWVANPDTNTTYTIDASTTTGGANFNLVGSDSTTDTIAFIGTGATAVTRTDANTVTISSTDNNTTYTQNFSSTTGGTNLNLVGSDSTTDTVKFANGTGVTVAYTDADTATLSIGQDVATTANPTFAGATLGNVTVGVNTDQTISTTTGDLILSVGSANIVSINNSNAGNPTYITRNTTGTSGGVRTLTLRTIQSNQPVIGFANVLEWQQDTAVGTTKRSGYVQVAPTNLTVGSESFRMDFGLMNANATAVNKLSLFGNGDLNMAAGGKFGIYGGTSGGTLLQAPTTGSTVTYTLPGADGSNGYILQTNGAGVLSWIANTDTNTTYSIDSTTTTGGANFNLNGSDSSIDTIKIANGTGITAVATDASTITVTNTGVTSAVAGTGIGVSAGTGAVTISNTGVTSAVAGTGVSVSSSTGAVTFSIGQSVATTASPTFAVGSFSAISLRGSTSGSVRFDAPATAGLQGYILPTGLPAANGYVLSSTTGGTMSWVAQSGGGSSATDFTPSFLLGGM